MQPPLVGEGGVDDTLGEGLGVVLPAELPPPPAHPTAKASTAAPPNSAIAVLAPDFIQRSILMSGRLVQTRVRFSLSARRGDAVVGSGDTPAAPPLSAHTMREQRMRSSAQA